MGVDVEDAWATPARSFKVQYGTVRDIRIRRILFCWSTTSWIQIRIRAVFLMLIYSVVDPKFFFFRIWIRPFRKFSIRFRFRIRPNLLVRRQNQNFKLTATLILILKKIFLKGMSTEYVYLYRVRQENSIGANGVS